MDTLLAQDTLFIGLNFYCKFLNCRPNGILITGFQTHQMLLQLRKFLKRMKNALLPPQYAKDINWNNELTSDHQIIKNQDKGLL